MKRILLSPASVLACMLFVVGCASERLALRLDIYGDDPLQPEFTPQQLESYANTLRGADQVIQDYANDRVELGERLNGAYEATFLLFAQNPPSPAERRSIENRKTWWNDYLAAVNEARDGAIKAAHGALRQVTAYQSLLQAPSTRSDARLRISGRILLEQALTDVHQAVQKLAGPLATHFERSLLDDFDTFRDSLTNAAGATNVQALARLRGEVNSLEQTIRRLANQGSANMKSLEREMTTAEQIAKAANQAQRESPLALAMKANPNAVASAMNGPGNSMPSVPDLTTNATRLMLGIAVARNGGDLDRFQDPADPVWRTLTDEKNEPNWHLAFATNYFYAEGNSSVIVVRDTPIHYRVQRGNNNPSALIQGQLRISRALTDAAIQIAGTAAGVKVPIKHGTNPAPAAVAATNATPETASLAEVNARIDAENAVRRQAYRTLRQRLNTLRTDFERADTNDVARIRLLGQFESALTGIAPIFKPEESTNQ